MWSGGKRVVSGDVGSSTKSKSSVGFETFSDRQRTLLDEDVFRPDIAIGLEGPCRCESVWLTIHWHAERSPTTTLSPRGQSNPCPDLASIAIADVLRTARQKKPLEVLGTYDPIPRHPQDSVGQLLEDKPKVKKISMNVDRIKYWLSVGAEPSSHMARLLRKVSFHACLCNC